MTTAPTSDLRHDIAAHAASKARRAAPADGAKVAKDMESNAYHDVADREVEARRTRRGSRALQFIGLGFGFIYLAVGLRIVLEALGARESSGFENFVDAISAPFVAPFEGLFPSARQGSMVLVFSFVAAFVAYVLLHFIVHKVVQTFARREELI